MYTAGCHGATSRVEEGYGKRRGEGKVQSRCQKEVNEEPKAKRLKETELMRAGRRGMGSKGSSWNQKTQRMLGSPLMYNDSKALGKILCSYAG